LKFSDHNNFFVIFGVLIDATTPDIGLGESLEGIITFGKCWARL
jgi:hypothetical protein